MGMQSYGYEPSSICGVLFLRIPSIHYMSPLRLGFWSRGSSFQQLVMTLYYVVIPQNDGVLVDRKIGLI